MKHWELTTFCVPYLKAVLCAVERTQLEFYGTDRNFLKIEEALTDFLEKIREAKHGGLHQLKSSQGTDHNSDKH